jgi:hypothetical protein
MALDNVPGVLIKEVRLAAPPIAGVGTSTAGFVGKAPKLTKPEFADAARLVTSPDQFIADYCGGDPRSGADANTVKSSDLSRAVLGFFANGGGACYVVAMGKDAPAADDAKAALVLFEPIDEIAIIAAPGFADQTVYKALSDQASALGDRFAILDPPPRPANASANDVLPMRPGDNQYAAFYYPRILAGPQLGGDAPGNSAVTPVGHIAGVYARVDSARGVHKAPANEVIRGALGVEHLLTDADQDQLNPKGVNLLRVFGGNVTIWGARTLAANTDTDWRYLSTRRLVNYIAESLKVGLRWAVFEPNTPALRQQIFRAVSGFLNGVWRDGALFGDVAEQSYYARFPESFNTDNDRALGKLTLEVGLRVAFPAEFIIVRIGLILQDPTAA